MLLWSSTRQVPDNRPGGRRESDLHYKFNRKSVASSCSSWWSTVWSFSQIPDDCPVVVHRILVICPVELNWWCHNVSLACSPTHWVLPVHHAHHQCWLWNIFRSTDCSYVNNNTAVSHRFKDKEEQGGLVDVAGNKNKQLSLSQQFSFNLHIPGWLFTWDLIIQVRLHPCKYGRPIGYFLIPVQHLISTEHWNNLGTMCCTSANITRGWRLMMPWCVRLFVFW